MTIHLHLHLHVPTRVTALPSVCVRVPAVQPHRADPVGGAWGGAGLRKRGDVLLGQGPHPRQRVPAHEHHLWIRCGGMHVCGLCYARAARGCAGCVLCV